MSAASHATAAAPLIPDVSHLFACTEGVDERVARLAAVVDPAFLAEVGWDADSLVLSPPPEHPLLGRPVCRVEGCSTTAATRTRICGSCRRGLAERGLSEHEIGLLPVPTGPQRGDPSTCGGGVRPPVGVVAWDAVSCTS